MRLTALGLPCFRAPPADGVGELMLGVRRKSQQIAGRNTCYGGRPRSRWSTPGRCPRGAEGRQSRHQPAQKLGLQPDIHGGDAVADKRPSELRDALSVGTMARRTLAGFLRRLCSRRSTLNLISNSLPDSGSAGTRCSSNSRSVCGFCEFFAMILTVILPGEPSCERFARSRQRRCCLVTPVQGSAYWGRLDSPGRCPWADLLMPL